METLTSYKHAGRSLVTAAGSNRIAPAAIKARRSRPLKSLK